MIVLGTFDPSVTKEALAAYQQRVQKLTAATVLPQWATQLRDESGWVGYTPLAASEPMKVAELQQFLRDAGFRPHGEVNGIFGYRTVAGISLFQEYVRTVEGRAEIGCPDGRVGNVTVGHVKRWQAAGLKADWAATSGANPSADYARWMTLLKAVQAKSIASPGPVQPQVSAGVDSDTVKVADWSFDPAAVHLIGIRRRKSVGQAQNLDDPYKLLIQGQVFTFYGSTEPGTKSAEEAKFPYLVPGQHHYRLGWHHQSNAVKVFQALKPRSKGVRVQRAAAKVATDAELKGPLDPRLNTSINVHWGGGGTKDEADWSAGCQVIVGNSYANHHGKVIDCSRFAAEGYAGLGTTSPKGDYQTKGAYTMLVSLIAALATDDGDNAVTYTLLEEADLSLDGEQFAADTTTLIGQLRTA